MTRVPGDMYPMGWGALIVLKAKKIARPPKGGANSVGRHARD